MKERKSTLFDDNYLASQDELFKKHNFKESNFRTQDMEIQNQTSMYNSIGGDNDPLTSNR